MRCSTSYRATTRYPEIPATGPRIAVRGDPRTGPRRLVIPHLMRNPEIPAGNTGSGTCPLRTHALDPASWCGVTRCDAESRNTHHVIPRYDAVSRNTRAGNTGSGTCPLRPLSGPRIAVRGDSHTGPRRLGHSALDAESRNTLPVIPHLMRNPEIPGREISAKAIPARGTFLDPASGAG